MLKHGKSQLQLFLGPVEKQSGTLRSAESATVDGVYPCDQPDPRFLQRTAVRNLWLCICFPNLSLEAVASPRAAPAAVFTGERGQWLIYACNLQASEAGIAPGMSINAALALLPVLDIRQRQPAAEQVMLQALANWALNYTPVVSIDAAGALLLEVRGSLHLFGGLRALRARLDRELRSGGHCVVMASAPIARSARWLARANSPADCTTPHELFDTLRSLPIACLDWPVVVQQKLLQIGVHTLGECIRLPRDGFARRIGFAYLQDLDQGFGRYAELLPYYRPPQRFSSKLDLAVDVLTTDEILIALEELFARLAAFLQQRQAGAQQLEVRFFHARRSPTVLTVSVTEVCTSIAHFTELCRLQLVRLLVPAPVTALSLQAPVVMASSAPGADLLGVIPESACIARPATASHEQVIRFVERLQARLGAECVYTLHPVAEHRPEYAWKAVDACDIRAGVSPCRLVSRSRPLWLLEQPVRLETISGRPAQHGIVIPLGDAERIESGWWDGRDVRRDYYRAVDRLGVRLWLYRDCCTSAWYLHGLFA